MLNKMIIMMALVVFFISGCMNMNSQENRENEQGNPNIQPINYETKREQNENPNKDYYQSDEEGIATDGKERNIFSTKEALEISQLLARRGDIKQAQVATLEDRVIVTIMLKNYTKPNHDITNIIEKDIQEIVPNKEIIIFTDGLQWDRMKDLDASLKQREIGENLEEYIEKYFNINVKD